MSLLARLTEKSWQTPGAADLADPSEYRPEAAFVGLWVYFAVVVVLFGLITTAYLMRMQGHGAAGEHDWTAIPRPDLLWANTTALILTSLSWEAARLALRRGRIERMRAGLIAAGVLGLLFLAGQLAVWRELHDSGYFLAGPSFCLTTWSEIGQPALHFSSSNPAIAFFYMITSIHGLHIAGGLGAWGRTIERMWTGTDMGRLVDLSAAYWHFLLLVWLAMFALILST